MNKINSKSFFNAFKKYFLIVLTILVLIGIGIFFYYRSTVFSREILKLEILGTDLAKVGEEIEYTIKYKNNGNFALEKAKITFELPENSLTEDGKIRFTQDLKDVYPGNEDFVKFKGRILGKEGDLKVAKATITYIPRNLSARYESTTNFITKIDTIPFTLTYDIPSKIEKGKEITYFINYFSNIEYPLENLSIKVDSIKGFNINNSEPVSLDKIEWKLKTLTKGQGGRIKIIGSATSEADNNIIFKSHLGMWKNGTFIIIKDVETNIEATQSAKLDLLQSVFHAIQSGIENSGPIPPKVGEPTTYSVKWLVKNYFKNIKNLKIKAVLPQNVSLQDNVFPEDQAPNFSFDSVSREVVWLAGNLPPDSSIEFTFQIVLIPVEQNKGALVNLINQATVYGEDESNGTIIQGIAPTVNTSLPDDLPNSGGGIVQ